MTRGLIVALVGPDGSGKTTVGRRLLDHRLSLPAEYLYMGFNAGHSNRLLPTTRLIEAIRARRKGTGGHAGRPPRAVDGDGTARPRRRGPLAGALGTVHLASRMTEDVYRQFLATRARRAGRIVILDRDSLLDHHVASQADGRGQTLGRRIQSAFLYRLYRRPDLVVYLDAPADVLMERKGEHTLEWLAERRRQYLAALELVPRHAVVDATLPLDVVTGEVAAAVEAAVGTVLAADLDRRPHRGRLAGAARPFATALTVVSRLARHGRRASSNLLTFHRARNVLADILPEIDGFEPAAGGSGRFGVRASRRWHAEPLHVSRDGAVLRVHVERESGAASLIVRLGRSPAAVTSVNREAAICRRIETSEALDDFRRLVPTVLAAGTHRGMAYVMERALPGRPAAAGRRPIASLDLGRAAAAIAPLRERTSRQVVVGEEMLDAWVTSRLATIGAIARRGDPAGPWQDVVDRLGTALCAEISGRTMTVATIHGDYWAGNILIGDDGAVTGIVDWDSAGWSELPLHDPVHLVLRSRAAALSKPLGSLVRDLIDGGSWSPPAARIIDPVRDGLDDDTIVLLYWIRAVTGSAERHPAVASEARWIRAAVLPPLAAFSRRRPVAGRPA